MMTINNGSIIQKENKKIRNYIWSISK